MRDVAAQLLCALKTAAGDLDNIGQIVMLQCFANAVSDYSEQSVLFNPASELFTAVFGGLILYVIAAVVIPTKSSVYPGC